jgi:hypothetical protein
VRRIGKNRYSFWSDSSDFRFQEAALLGPEQFNGIGAIRPNSGMLGLLVGYSSNFLSVIKSDSRHVLHNRHDRANISRRRGRRP